MKPHLVRAGLGLAIALFLASPAFAWNEPDSVLGVRWEASKAETLKVLVKRFHEYSGPESMRDVYTSDMFKPRCQDNDHGVVQMCHLGVTHIGPVEGAARWWFRDAKFVWSDFNFQPKTYSDLRQIFIERYGPPTDTTQREAEDKGRS